MSYVMPTGSILLLIALTSILSTMPAGAVENIAPANNASNKKSIASDMVPAANDIRTAETVSQLTGQPFPPALMASPIVDDQPIRGFHPIKRFLQPIVSLQKNSILLQQQIMRLEGPIASLQTPMLGLQYRMTGVQDQMVDMQKHLRGMRGTVRSMQDSVVGVRSDMHTIGNQMSGVRTDLTGMQSHIVRLEAPIRELYDPIVNLQRPIETLASPVTGMQKQLAAVEKQLADLKGLLSIILFAIFLAAAAISFGTPVAALLVYKNRHSLFPNTRERDFPGIKAEAPARSETTSS